MDAISRKKKNVFDFFFSLETPVFSFGRTVLTIAGM